VGEKKGELSGAQQVGGRKGVTKPGTGSRRGSKRRKKEKKERSKREREPASKRTGARGAFTLTTKKKTCCAQKKENQAAAHYHKRERDLMASLPKRNLGVAAGEQRRYFSREGA